MRELKIELVIHREDDRASRRLVTCYFHAVVATVAAMYTLIVQK